MSPSWARRIATGVLLGSIAILHLDSASAQPGPARVELTPYAGFRFGGTFEDEEDALSVELDDRNSSGLILDLRESENTQWEIIYSRQQTVADTSQVTGLGSRTDVDVEHLQGGGTYEGLREGSRPYLALTLGGARMSPRVAELHGETFWSFSIGAGLKLRPTDRVGIRLEARAWGTLIDSDTRLFCRSGIASAACSIEVDGRILWQLETFAGLVFRF